MNSRIDFSSLHDSILSHIFDLNTDMTKPDQPARKGFTNCDDKSLTEVDDEGDFHFFASLGHRSRFYALTITLRTSQVCHRWRQLLLASPSVWGRLIDLDLLTKTNLLLREELFRRAGNNSLISVKGFNIPYPSPTCDFVFGLIRKHWARLEWVDIYILTKVKLSRQQSQFWSTITTPAPNLRRFSFVFSIPITTNPRILTANAPALKELCTSPSSPIRLESPWLRQLTFLSIDGVGEPTLQVTLSELLSALPYMSHLETLRLIHSRIAEGIYNHHQPVQLPSLRNLILEDHFNTCFTILLQLAPSADCAVVIRAKHPHDIPSNEYWVLTDSLEKYLEKRTYNDRLFIDMQPNSFSFVDAFPDCYPAPTVSIQVDYDPHRDSEFAPSFFGVFPRNKFEHVKNLLFCMNLPDLEDIGDFIPVFDDFIYGLESLEVLKTTTQGFLFLAMSSSSIDENDEIPVPLPKLQRLRMMSPSDNDDDPEDMELGSQFIDQFIRLFKMRKARRSPIKHLDVRGYVGDLRKLDQCKKLKVTWFDARYRDNGQQGEYICGSGNREVLDIDD